MPAPIALFAYKRPDHLRRVLDALAANPEAATSDIFVFSDAPRDAAATAGVEAVRQLLRGPHGFARLTPVLRDCNLGLARSIIDGVGRICDSHERVIVLEDDLEVAPYFLAYMNSALAHYSDEERVASIHGYTFPVPETLPETFFLRGADCWGWATWRRAWHLFEPDGASLLEALQARGLTNAFDLDGAYGFTSMLRDQIAGRNDSWAIRWHAATFLANKLTLYPGRSLVQNIGADGSGTHVDRTDAYRVRLATARVEVRAIPVEESTVARGAFARFLTSIRPSVWRRLSGRLRRLAGS